MNYMQQWRESQNKIQDDYIEVLVDKFPLTDVTTNRQRKNNTRMLELNHPLIGKIRFAVYESGMVRKIIRTRFNELSCYQLNPQRSTNVYYMHMDKDNKLIMGSYKGKQRVKITNSLARLIYLENYLIKNYNLHFIEDVIMVNGKKYKRI